MRSALAGMALLLSAALVGTPASASAPRDGRTVIEVYPGPNAIRNALGSAQPGDVLNIHAGTYPEHVTVSVDDVTLQAAGDGTVTVDGTCTASVTVDVTAEGVSLVGLTVVGATGGFEPIEIDFSFDRSGSVSGSHVQDTCGDAQYGINVYNGGSIQITGNTATGFGDAGIYIGQITSTPFGPMVVSGNESFGNVRGIIVENSSGGQIQVQGNFTHDNQITGIWITNSDRVRIERNNVRNNHTSGIELDQLSDRNIVRRNKVQGHTYDLANDGGTGNCFLDNVYTTSFGVISC